MTDTEADMSIGCYVRICDTDNSAKGLIYILDGTFYEFTDTGESKRGVVLKDIKPKCSSFYETTARHIEVIDTACYQKLKYMPAKGLMSIKEIFEHGGGAVKYQGRCVRIRKIYKAATGSRCWWYKLRLQDVKPPYRVYNAECNEIEPWDGEQPAPVIKELPPIAQRKLKEIAETDRIKAIQEETLAALKAAVV